MAAPVPLRPAPRPLVPATGPATPWPVDALGPLADVARALHDRTQAPEAICAQSALAAAALLVQGHVTAETLAGPAPAGLFLLTIAQSGERKSTVDRLALAPIRRALEVQRDEWREAHARWRLDQGLWEEERRRLSRGSRSFDRKREALEKLGPPPPEPIAPDMLSSDPTLEGLTRNMDRLPPALGIFSDEGGAFFGGYGMQAERRMATLAGFSALWDGAPVTRLRAGDGAQTHAGRRLTAHLLVQPRIADQLLRDPLALEQGFLARFLISAPPSAIGARFSRAEDGRSRAVLTAWEDRCMGWMFLPPALRPGARNELDPPLLPLSGDARRVLRDFADEVERRQAADGDLESVRPFASKSAEQAARIAAFLAAVAGEGEVAPRRIADAIRIARHHLSEALRLCAAAPARLRRAEELRLWLTQDWPDGVISVTEVSQFAPRPRLSAPQARQALELLESHGWIEPIPEGATIRGARRKRAWRVVGG